MGKIRTREELIQDATSYLNELFGKFGLNKKVSYKQLQISKLAKKYRIGGRLQRVLIREEFIVAKRWYYRRFEKFPPLENIIGYIEEARNIRKTEYKRYYSNLSTERKKEIHKKKYRAYRRNTTAEERHEIGKQAYEWRKRTWKAPEDKAAFYKNVYWRGVERRLRYELLKKEIEQALPKVINYCKTITHDYKDLVQETFLKAWQIKRRYKAGTNISAWLISIAKQLNKRINFNNSHSPEVAVDEFFNEVIQIPEPEQTPTELVEECHQEQQLTDKVRGAMVKCYQAMPPKLKPYLEYFSDGMSHEEIAEILHTNKEYSKTRLYKARQRFIDNLEKELNVKIPPENIKLILNRNFLTDNKIQKENVHATMEPQ